MAHNPRLDPALSKYTLRLPHKKELKITQEQFAADLCTEVPK